MCAFVGRVLLHARDATSSDRPSILKRRPEDLRVGSRTVPYMQESPVLYMQEKANPLFQLIYFVNDWLIYAVNQLVL